MVIFDQIVELANNQNKNILVLGSARSGTHAVGSELADRSAARYLGELCAVDSRSAPWQDIETLYDVSERKVAQVVRFLPKLHLASQVNKIKQHTVIVNVCRKNKIKQFASWMYFKNLDYTKDQQWHNHKASHTKIQPGTILVQEQDIEQFLVEQLLDFYFSPDFNLCYEQLTFTQKRFKKNEFAYPLEDIFSNLDYVKQTLSNWEYCVDYFNQR